MRPVVRMRPGVGAGVVRIAGGKNSLAAGIAGANIATVAVVARVIESQAVRLYQSVQVARIQFPVPSL